MAISRNLLLHFFDLCGKFRIYLFVLYILDPETGIIHMVQETLPRLSGMVPELAANKPPYIPDFSEYHADWPNFRLSSKDRVPKQHLIINLIEVYSFQEHHNIP